MTDKSRFTDNGNGTISDQEMKLMWRKTDSFQDTKKMEKLVHWPRIHAN